MSTMERIGDTAPASTPIERLSAGLAILAAHDPKSEVFSIRRHEDDDRLCVAAKDAPRVATIVAMALHDLGWVDDDGAWEFPL